MATANPMSLLYKRLASAGFKPKFVRDTVLPSWWDDEIATTEAGYLEGLIIISKHLGIQLDALRNPAAALQSENAPARFFKGPELASDEGVAVAIAERAARIAILGMIEARKPVTVSASIIRRRLLGAGAAWIGFQELLQFCWNSNIPVIHVARLPAGVKKLRAVTVSVDGRPAIVFFRHDAKPAQHLFPLAHEIGHIYLNHLEFFGLIVDTETEFGFNETTEREANRFARELLTGGEELPQNYSFPPRPAEIARGCQEYANRLHIDPSFLVGEWVKKTKQYKEARTAVNFYIQQDENALAMMAEEMSRRIDWDLIPEESQEYLLNLTRVETR
ncbi:hypothetical protein CCAX7_11460 [Capsulimonas corticalis]|uniref:Uncharacterized protein n=1 Tax=Capsulimonas corticalis TaxID=2219043 RepID=A0A402CUT6_9BACT|nr:ImmA/IrrE family metallo-endopeptidase [Capsulimonas corticalis]BDI29095.1 hypothetical protein CCAX7_11460 [Capsulimonas corticalis]